MATCGGAAFGSASAHRRPLRGVWLAAGALLALGALAQTSSCRAFNSLAHTRRHSFFSTRTGAALRATIVTRRAASSPEAEASQELFKKLFSGDQRPVVLYDGVCNMCNSAVDLALQKDPEGKKLRFAALQSDIGQGLLVFCGRRAEDLSSMIVVKPDGTCLAQSDAALFVGKQLDSSPLLKGASEVASQLIPKAVRDVAYDTLAANRYKVLGKRQELRVGQAGLDDRFIGNVVPSGV